MDLTADELKLLINLVEIEGLARKRENELWDQHEEARRVAERTGKRVQGVCPTMFRNPHGRTNHKTNCAVLAAKLDTELTRLG